MTPPPEPAGLYLHIPFCSAICPYCDFAVAVARRPERRVAFVEVLVAEIGMHGPGGPAAVDFGGFDTIYLGGGTPSILRGEELARLLEALRRQLDVAADASLFLEANPEDVDLERLADWRRLGVRFLSLGVQSFDDRDLAFLGRRHDAATARRSVELALAAGFDTVSIDLIYGLPHHDTAAWRPTLATAVELAPQHLSCYELTIHRRTTFGKRQARGELRELPDDAQAELFLLTHRSLAEAGYPAYEVSSFATDAAHRSRHNRKYWRHAPYLGLGPSAHSFDGRRRRWWNERLTPRYEKRIRAGECARDGWEELSDADLALETVMLGLRTPGGVDLARFAERFGVDLVAANRERLERLSVEGLLEHPPGRLVPTVRGLAVADALAAGLRLAQ